MKRTTGYRSPRAPLPLLAAGLLLLGACGGGDSSSEEATSETPDGAGTGAETGDPGGSEAGDATTPDATTPEPLDIAAPDIDEPQPGPTRTVDLVDPRIATGGVGWNVGSGFPGATAPFGMVRVSPDTTGEAFGDFPAFHCAGYHAVDDVVRGFSHTRLYGVGIPEYGNVMVMPTRGALASGAPDPSSSFDDATEKAHPGYYSVLLADTGTLAEMTATTRAAHHRWTWEEGADDALVVLDLDHTVPSGEVMEAELVDLGEGRFEGRVFQQGAFSDRYGGIEIWFAARFDPPPPEQAVDAHRGVFSYGSTERVEAQFGISFVDQAGAHANLEAELPTWDFEGTRQATEDTWEELLETVTFEGGTEDERVIMATAVYHAYQMPTVMTDVDGRYTGFDREIHQADGWTYHSDFSLWDTYRTQHPLFTLIGPELQRDFLRSMVAMLEQGGDLPKWPQGVGYTNAMVGTPADIVFAESVLKGIDEGYDLEAAWQNMKALAEAPPTSGSGYEGRSGVSDYITHGFLPADLHGGSVSKTLEFAYADFALAGLADFMGEPDVATEFLDRAEAAYAHLWDPETQFMLGKSTTGEVPEVNPLVWADIFTEGDAWQYLWFVPWDVPGLVDLFGSADALNDKLETFFIKGAEEQDALVASRVGLEETELSLEQLTPATYYWHGNEPDIHAAYLFLESGRPDLTQRWVRWIMDALYSTQPAGLAGNDDAGTLSSWYVFSAVGLYPLAGSTRYYLGSPIFERAELQVAGGTLIIEAPATSAENLYVHGVTWNGEAVDVPWIEHDQLSAGGTLRFEMAAEPL